MESLLTTAAPSVGIVVATVLFSSPMKAVLRIKAARRLDDFNPIPMVFIVWNCLNWLTYGLVTDNLFIFFANQPGLCLGVWYVGIAHRYADAKLQARMEAMLLAIAFITSSVGLASVVTTSDPDTRATIWGVTGNLVLLVFYGSPLSTMATVLRKRDASSLTLPLCWMNVINGSVWWVYGSLVADYFVAAPNAVGAVLGCVQVALCYLFPATRKTRDSDGALTGLVNGDPRSDAVTVSAT